MCRPTQLWKDAENLTTYDCVLWCSLIVHVRPYPLNTTIAFYFVIECSNIAVFVRLRACRATTHLYFTWPWPVLDLASYCCDRKSLAACAQSFAPWQQATVEIMLGISLTIASSRYTYDGVILPAHPVRGESHNQRNTTGEVATLLCSSVVPSVTKKR